MKSNIYIKDVLSKIHDLHTQLIEECSKEGINGNIQTVFQFGDENVFPHMNNSKFLKYGSNEQNKTKVRQDR
jgi:hypothetical protein